MLQQIRRFGSFALLSMALVALAGCKDFGSPSGVVGTAGSALRDNDAKLFYETLTGKALEKYGNVAGMQKLQEKVSGYSKVKGKQAKLLADNGKLQSYSVVVSGKKGREWVAVLDARVLCEVDEHWVPGNPGNCHPVNGQMVCGPGDTSHYAKEFYCQISDLLEL